MAKQSKYTKSKLTLAGDKPLYYPDDEAHVRELINEAIRRKRFIKRESKHHLKHRKVNYFPSTEVITIDGQSKRHDKTGPNAFLELLDEMYPRQWPKSPPLSSSPTRPDSPPPSSLPTNEVNLKDNDSFTLEDWYNPGVTPEE
jgi:hypothetical protein